MKKSVLLIVLMAAMFTVFTACGDTTSTTPTTAPTAAPTATTAAEAAATTEPTTEPAATTEPTTEPAATTEPTAEPTATTEPTTEPTATAEPTEVPPTPTETPASIDYDLTVMAEEDMFNIFFAMLDDPNTYAGKTIRVAGNFATINSRKTIVILGYDSDSISDALGFEITTDENLTAGAVYIVTGTLGTNLNDYGYDQPVINNVTCTKK